MSLSPLINLDKPWDAMAGVTDEDSVLMRHYKLRVLGMCLFPVFYRIDDDDGLEVKMKIFRHRQLSPGDDPCDSGVPAQSEDDAMDIIRTLYGDGAVCDVQEILSHY